MGIVVRAIDSRGGILSQFTEAGNILLLYGGVNSELIIKGF